MLEFQLPTKDVDYLDIVLPASGVGLVARWGTQFTPFTVAVWDTPSPKPKWKKTAERLYLSADGTCFTELERETGDMHSTRVGGRKAFTLNRSDDVDNVSTAIAPEGKDLAWKSGNYVIVCSLPGGDLLAEIKTGFGTNLQFSAGGRWLTEEGSRVLRVFDRQDGYRLFATIKTPEHIVSAITDGLTAVVTTPDRSTVSVWDLTKTNATATFTVGGWICGLAISPDGKHILAGNTDGRFAMWDAEGSLVKEYNWGIACPLAPTFSRDGTRAAVGGDDGRIIVWDLGD